MTSETAEPSEGGRPQVFQIGMTGLGTRWLRRIFRGAGYAVAPPQSAQITHDIVYAARTGGTPLTAERGVDLFTDLEYTSSQFEPPLHAQEEFRLLHAHFPDAYFLLNVGDLDSWLRRRAAADDGTYVRAAAHALDVDPSEVPALWRRRWLDHRRSVLDHFADDKRFLVLDVDHQGLTDLAAFLSADYDLSAADLPRAPRRPQRGAAAAAAAPSRDGVPHSASFVDSVVEFATRSDPSVPTGMPWRRTSGLYAHWDGGDAVLDNRDRPLPYAVDLTSPRWPFLLDTTDRKHRRTEGVLNELWQHGGRRGARVDMQDARRYGVPETGAPDSPVLTFCRLEGAANLVLWPLPGYHTPGSPDFPGATSADTLTFREKSDTVAWRGNLTGRAVPELGPAGVDRQHATQLAAELGSDRDAEVLAALETVPRFRLLSRLVGRPDADVGLSLGEKWSSGEVPAPIARLVRPRLDYSELYRHRYLLSMSGNDSASNFLMAADSGSVVLREEDGWEWFYDGLFRPWEHYVPLVRGGDDLEDRLEWARAHPQECEEMSHRARTAIRMLVDPGHRAAYLTGIRETYESRL